LINRNADFYRFPMLTKYSVTPTHSFIIKLCAYVFNFQKYTIYSNLAKKYEIQKIDWLYLHYQLKKKLKNELL
jgi:hypothetical protein